MNNVFVKFEVVEGEMIVTMVQNEEENGTLTNNEIVMNARSFANTIYILKALEEKLNADCNKQIFSQDEEAERLADNVENIRPKTPTPPDNFEELFANIKSFDENVDNDNSVWMHESAAVRSNEIGIPTDGEQETTNRNASIDETDEKRNISEYASGNEEYDPINFSIIPYEPITVPVKSGKRFYNVKEEKEEKEDHNSLSFKSTSSSSSEIEMMDIDEAEKQARNLDTSVSVNVEECENSGKNDIITEKIVKKGSMRSRYLNKYAKLLCTKFWDAFDLRCADAKNNRAFLRMTQKEQISKLFDEIHLSVGEEEFTKALEGCAMGKDIFTSCSKTRAKLLALIYKFINE